MPEHPASPRPVQPLVLLIRNAVVLCLFLVRFFMVAESAAAGDSLWVVALWLAVFVLWITPTGSAEETKIGWLDLCVGLFITPQIISAISVIATSGDKRAAINLLWEWVGTAVAWLLLRQHCRRPAFRRDLVIGMIATGTVVAALGLYQHYVDFPRTAEKYGPLFDRLSHADAAEAASLKQILARDHIPTEGPGLILFEKRLRDSREPLGLFALANTLGGFLAVCLVLVICIAATELRIGEARMRIRLWAWIPLIAILSLCLVLTKSRTAWIGTAFGLGFWALASGFTKRSRIPFRLVAGVIALVVVTGWGLIHFGGLDRQVLTEAPKSLQYRLQYWSATLPLIKDHVWLGVGPGQFRSNYLFYKLPEASEEISDPHNLFLDAAANGGIFSLLGLIAICAAVVTSFQSAPSVAANFEISSNPSHVLSIVTGIAAIAWSMLLFSGEDDRLLVLLPIAIALIWFLQKFVRNGPEADRTIRLASVSAAMALLVHLAGAGGIGMPAVSLLFLGLVGVAEGEKKKTLLTFKPRRSLFVSGTLLALVLCLEYALFLTGLRPVWLVPNHVSAGDQFMQRGQPERADAEYAAAANIDQVSSEPWRRRAELAYRRSEAGQFHSNDLFLNAVRLMRESSARDPRDFHGDRELGNWWLTRWRRTNQSADAQEAVAAFRSAWLRYPTNAQLMADLAFALDASGAIHDASAVAEKAIRQDDINHQCGHVDKYLPDPIRTRLNTLATRRPVTDE